MKAQLLLVLLIAAASTSGIYPSATSSLSSAYNSYSSSSGSSYPSSSSSSYTSSTSSSSSLPNYPKADLSTLYASSTNGQVTYDNIQNAIKNSQSTIITPTRSIDSLFSRLPSTTELDELILSADSVALLKTVQTLVSDDSIPCSQIVAYLSELLGRIKTAIQKKTFAADQLKIIIDAAKAEITRLQNEIAKIQDQVKSYWLDELANKLKDLVAQLEPLYKQFNEVESQIAPNEARIAGFEKEIAILQKSSDDERNRAANDRLKLTETEAKIRDLQGQLQAAQNTAASLNASIAKSQAIINQNDLKIADARSKIADLEGKIRRLKDQGDALRAKITDLEIQVERLRTDIAVAQTKADNSQNQINDLNARILVEQKKLVNGDLRKLQDMIDILSRLLPGIEAEIDRQYFYCYGDGAVTEEKTGSVLVFIVRGESFGNYINNAYGITSIPNASNLRGDVRLNSCDIFSSTWTSKFGYPFAIGAFNTSGMEFGGDFGCLNNPSSAKSGSGTIQSIKNNQVSVKTSQGSNVNLNLGACSRIEATTSTPQVGQTVAFKGVQSGAQGFNVVAMTCW